MIESLLNNHIFNSITIYKCISGIYDLRNNRVPLVKLFLVIHNEYNTPNEYSYHMNAEEYKEKEEVSVIATTDAIVNPRTVMIKGLRDQLIVL